MRPPAPAAPADIVRRAAAAYLRVYHRHRIDVDAPLPDEPALVVGNHGFGGLVDLNVSALMAALDAAGVRRPVTYLVHQIAWTLGAGRFTEAFGGRPASTENAHAAFAAGGHVVVFPGGDVDAGKSWRDRDRVLFDGRCGYARLAIEAGVPIVPIVSAGAGESLVVLTDGQALARALRLPSLLRLKALPVSLSLPWGLSVGVVGLAPYLPLPTRMHTVVLPAMRPEDSEDAAAFAARVQHAMQDRLDELVAERIPVLG